MPTFAQRLELPPGYHYITANFEGFYTVYGERGLQDCRIEFEAVAGHDYRIDYKTMTDDQWSAWLVDTASGQRIVDCIWTNAPVRSWTPRPTPTATPPASSSLPSPAAAAAERRPHNPVNSTMRLPRRSALRNGDSVRPQANASFAR